VYGTSIGAASSDRNAWKISATALPIPVRAPRRGVTSIATEVRALADTSGFVAHARHFPHARDVGTWTNA
jgi:hypothetical protein